MNLDKVGYLRVMSAHFFRSGLLLALLTLAACSSSTPTTGGAVASSVASTTVTREVSPSTGPVFDLQRLSSDLRTMSVSGTVSATGVPQAVARLPFNAVVAGRDSMMIAMTPFGMTAAKLFATQDSFVFVDYLQRQVIDGRPTSPELVGALPFPLSVSDLTSLIRGEVPGDIGRFREVSVRQDGSVVFGADYRDGREFVLIDTATATLRQYQKKRTDGVIDLNVTFDEVKRFNDVPVAMAVDVTVNDRRQTMSFRLSEVTVNGPMPQRLRFDVPSGFSRKSFR